MAHDANTKFQRTHVYVRSEVLTAVRMTMLVFWVLTPCRLVSRYLPVEHRRPM
jgi:hypothetical protein